MTTGANSAFRLQSAQRINFALDRGVTYVQPLPCTSSAGTVYQQRGAQFCLSRVVTAQTVNPAQLVEQGVQRYWAGEYQTAVDRWQRALDAYQKQPAKTAERSHWCKRTWHAHSSKWDKAMLHSFYSGAERIFREIARTVDASMPESVDWHRRLLRQMSIATKTSIRATPQCWFNPMRF